MRTVEKISLACAVTLILSCVASILALSLTDIGSTFFKPAFEVLARARAVSALSGKYPFGPPADGIIPERRLEAFLRASAKAKPSAEALDAWLEGAHGGKGPGHGSRGPTLTGAGASRAAAFLKDLEEGLGAEGMCLGEFLWIRNRLNFASDAAQDKAREEEIRLEIDQIRELAADPQTPPKARESLDEHIRTLETLPWAPGPAREANRNLCARHQDRIRANRLPDRAVTLASDYAASSPGETRTVVLEKETGAEPAPPPR